MRHQLIYLLGNLRLRSLTCTVFQTRSALAAPKKDLHPYHPQRVREPAEYAALDPVNRRILMRLCLRLGMHGSLARLEGEDGAETIEILIRTGCCFWESPRGKPLQWGPERAGQLDWQPVEKGRFQPVVLTKPPSAVLLPVCPLIYVEPNTRTAGRVSTGLPSGLVLGWLMAAEEQNAAEHASLHQQLSIRFPGFALPAPPRVTVEEIFDERPAPVLDLGLSSSCSTEGLQAALRFEYAGRSIAPSSEQTVVERLDGTRLRRFHRNKVAEAEAIDLLQAIGFMRTSPGQTGTTTVNLPAEWVYQPTDADSADRTAMRSEHAGRPDAEGTLTEGLRALEQKGWRLTWRRSRELTALAEDAWYTGLTSGQWNWFEFEAGIEVNGKRINLLPVLHNLLQQFRGWPLAQIRRRLLTEPVCVPIGDGRAGIVPGERLWRVVEQLFELMDDAPLGSNQRLTLDSLRTAEIMALEEFAAAPWETTRQVRRLMELLRRGIDLQPQPEPAGLRAELRNYQKEGLAWLQLLREYEMDGILADDMGLGKTVQTLAHLLVEKEAGRLTQPCLIVSPTSVLSNWAAELERHAPGLTWMILHGNDRGARFAKLGTVDVALTTYPLLYRDAERYHDRPFSYVILDEAQFIKNARSQAAQVVSRLTATRRLCLTGTPLENHLGELWSLFHFLMPGFLGDPHSFKSRFRDPIEKQGLADRQVLLSRRVAPFLLRRTKTEVERELPPKTEIIQSIPLTARQQELYESVRAAMDRRIQDEIQAKGLGRSHIIVLDALLKLRQICCDPRLLVKGRSKCNRADSGKLTALLELLPELIEDQRRVLLFSQFTSMLALIETEVRRLKIPYVLLTGSTRDRTEPIRRFQARQVPLFLISLKAGGTGLNLTAADTVIHYDPWWNPAVENQATDRAHRIGQDNPVFVYKLLTEGTVEAKIQQLQEKKRRLVEGILAGSLKGKLAFTEADLAMLLEPVRAVSDD